MEKSSSLCVLEGLLAVDLILRLYFPTLIEETVQTSTISGSKHHTSTLIDGLSMYTYILHRNSSYLRFWAGTVKTMG